MFNIEELKGKEVTDELFAKLKEHEADLIGQRDAARNESISGRKGLKSKLESAEALAHKLMEKLGISTEEELESLPDARGAAEAAKQYEAKVRKLERDLAAATKGMEEAIGKQRTSAQRATIAEALGAHEFVAPDLVQSFIDSRVVWEGDDLLFKGDDGKLISVRDGVAGFAKSRPELMKSTGAGGAGVRPSNAGGNGAVKQMTRAEFDALPPARRMALSKEGVTLT